MKCYLNMTLQVFLLTTGIMFLCAPQTDGTALLVTSLNCSPFAYDPWKSFGSDILHQNRELDMNHRSVLLYDRRSAGMFYSL